MDQPSSFLGFTVQDQFHFLFQKLVFAIVSHSIYSSSTHNFLLPFLFHNFFFNSREASIYILLVLRSDYLMK